MKSLKVKLAGIALLAVAMFLPAQAMAQWKLGVSYQIRDEAPEQGFGVRIERQVLGQLPLIDLRLRAHFAYFNENNDISWKEGITLGEVTYYDYGLSGFAGVSLGFLKPYVGLGIGASTIDFIKNNDSGEAVDEAETAFNWSGFVGVELTPIPRINPFIEYRFEPVDEADQAFDDVLNSDGRLIIGVSLSF